MLLLRPANRRERNTLVKRHEPAPMSEGKGEQAYVRQLIRAVDARGIDRFRIEKTCIVGPELMGTMSGCLTQAIRDHKNRHAFRS